MSTPTDVPGGFARLLTAVRAAEIGLLRAVAIDLIVADGDGETIDMRGLRAYPLRLTRSLTGRATVRAQAHRTPSGDSWTYLGRTDLDVVVNAHVSKPVASGNGIAACDSDILRAAVRATGTHGSARVDLLRPRLDIRTSGSRDAWAFGGEPLAATLERFSAQLRGDDASDADLKRALDALEASADSGAPADFTW